MLTSAVGNYFKNLIMSDDSRFTKHPRFRFFALNTEMWWHALHGTVYVKQHPGDAPLTLDELHDMVGRQGEASPTECFTTHPVCVATNNIGVVS